MLFVFEPLPTTLAADAVESDESDGWERTGGRRDGGEEDDEGHEQVPGVKQKWKLLPHFLKLRGLMRQHIDSYDYFVNVDISKVSWGESSEGGGGRFCRAQICIADH